jgi:hypothetical protein
MTALGIIYVRYIFTLACSTLAAYSRGIKRFLTPSNKTRRAAWCAMTPCGKTRFLPRLAASISNRSVLRGNRRVLPQGVAHQPQVCAQHAARLGVKNRLMPGELATSVLPALVSDLKIIQQAVKLIPRVSHNNSKSFLRQNCTVKIFNFLGENLAPATCMGASLQSAQGPTP